MKDWVKEIESILASLEALRQVAADIDHDGCLSEADVNERFWSAIRSENEQVDVFLDALVEQIGPLPDVLADGRLGFRIEISPEDAAWIKSRQGN